MVLWLHNNFISPKSIWTKKVPYNVSWCFKKILNARELSFKFVQYEIGPHSNFLFWHDPLFEHQPLIERFNNRIISISETSSLEKIGEFILENCWSLPTSNHMLVIDLHNLISNTPIHNRDVLLWGNTKIYTISVSHICIPLEELEITYLGYRLVWQPLSIPKCAFISWLALKNRLYKKERMIRFGLNIDPICVLCRIVPESAPHLFAECNFSKSVLQDSTFNGIWSEYLFGNFLSVTT